MRILFATESYHPNIDGGAVAQGNLVRQLSLHGHHVGVIAPSSTFKNYEEKHEDATIFRIAGVTLPIYREYKFSPFPLRRVKRIIDNFRPNVVNVNSPYPIGLSALYYARKKGIAVVGLNCTQPENMFMAVSRTSFVFNFLNHLGWLHLIRFYNGCDYVTSPTKTGVNILKRNGLKVDASPITNGIDLKIFNPKNDGSKLRKLYSIPDKPVVLYTGRISGEKRLDVLIRAIPLVLEKLDVHFVIAGDGREAMSIRDLATKLNVRNNVTFTGFIDWKDFPNIYKIADLFAIPSEAELQSIVTMEALASGLPVVATNKDALPELAHDAQNGYLFEPGNAEDMAAKIIAILSDDNLRKRMGARSLEIIQEHSLEKVGFQYEKVYREVINRKGKI
jgi:glycosyltransferase involved in cell wall biosynthesis